MIEMLQVIVSICQLQITEGSYENINHLKKHERFCQNAIIRCIDKKVGMRMWHEKDLKECLLERG